MDFTLPKLPYTYNALEPYIDARTMEIHHSKHHQGYIDKLKAAVEGNKEVESMGLKEALEKIKTIPEDIRSAVKNNGGGHYNHSLFWSTMSPDGRKTPSGELAVQINQKYGTFDVFKEKFSKEAATRFGSGWAWLCVDNAGDILITSSSNQDCPLSEGLIPILALDVWEHAYYLNYQNKRPDYIEAWWNVVNWKQVEENFEKSTL